MNETQFIKYALELSKQEYDNDLNATNKALKSVGCQE